eukprot:scaffold258397_cov31-Tisochrysis_lutea.AAC.1
MRKIHRARAPSGGRRSQICAPLAPPPPLCGVRPDCPGRSIDDRALRHAKRASRALQPAPVRHPGHPISIWGHILHGYFLSSTPPLPRSEAAIHRHSNRPQAECALSSMWPPRPHG